MRIITHHFRNYKKRRDKIIKKQRWGVRTQNPGETVSVNQLVSLTPGLVAQLTGRLTTKRCKYDTVYADQASWLLSIPHLQNTAYAEETIKAKKAFELYAHNDHNVRVRAYHTDNGTFKAHKWIDECKRSGRRLTCEGVDAHHQNGIAERHIHEL